MYFKKFFFNGESFPKRFAVYHCKPCNKEEYIEAPVGKNFDGEPIKCPTCKCVDEADKKEQLLKKREDLTVQIGKLQAELDRVSVEIVTGEEYKSKEQVKEKVI